LIAQKIISENDELIAIIPSKTKANYSKNDAL
jgi:hypothetical protein